MFSQFRLALDNQLSKPTMARLEKLGVTVVLRAQDEDDEDWIEYALHLGANVFVSPDLDIPNYLDRRNSDAIWIDVPQYMREHRQAEHIISELKRILKRME